MSSVIGKQMAFFYKKELESGTHRTTGRELTQDEKTHRCSTLMAYCSTLPLRFRSNTEKLVQRIETSVKAEADRVIEASNTHVTATGDRVAQEVIAALKEDKGPEWRDDMTDKEQKVFYQNRRAADLNQMRDLGLVSKPAQPTEKSQGPKCVFYIEVR